ncbi:MAG: class I SAM-dependent methyltransferase [Candidatus Parcubacteria bacterium]|nr:class I SAM-dependent methyltransferase [Candidatus Parcubacteria bacterium]
MNKFWDKYYQKPLNEIPWQNTQADWFKELVDRGEITGDSALDLGCGTGKKSVYLAQYANFKKVVGVDISERAIKYAKSNAQDNNVEKICTFIGHDLNDWFFLPKNELFDFILDWAAIHCFTRDKIKKYADNITRHCKTGGKFLVRSFASRNSEQKEFSEEVGEIKSKVSLFNEDELRRFFPQFRILSQNTSQPSKSKADAGYYFIELLMQKE